MSSLLHPAGYPSTPYKPSHPRKQLQPQPLQGMGFLSCNVSGCSYIPNRLALVTWSGHCLPIFLQFICWQWVHSDIGWEELHLFLLSLHLSLNNLWTHLSSFLEWAMDSDYLWFVTPTSINWHLPPSPQFMILYSWFLSYRLHIGDSWYHQLFWCLHYFNVLCLSGYLIFWYHSTAASYCVVYYQAQFLQ